MNCTESFGKKQVDTKLLQRVFMYANTFPYNEIPDSVPSNVYLKYRTHIDRKNLLLLAIPAMYDVARDRRRDFLNESFSNIVYYKDGKEKTKTLLMYSTVYHSHKLLPVLFENLQPSLYDVTLFKGIILSPLKRSNKRFYHYKSIKYGISQTRFFIRPKIKNTQLVKGWIIIDDSTGKVDRFFFEGEYDMIHFVLQGEMGKSGIKSLLPKRCDIIAKIRTLGNQFRSWITSVYDINCTLPDSIHLSENRNLLDRIRPVPLTTEEEKIIETDDSIRKSNTNRSSRISNQAIYSDKTKQKESTSSLSETTESTSEIDSASEGIKKDGWKSNDSINKNLTNTTNANPQKFKYVSKHIFWDVIGNNILNDINTNIGDKKQGHIKIHPIFNPFYFGYSRNKGIIYRFDVKGYYNFTPNQSISTRIKMGYSFKWKRLLYNIPVTFTYNQRRNGWVKIEYFNGNRITNSNILDEIKDQKPDSIDWNKLNLDYFNDLGIKVSTNYQIIKNHLDLQSGLVWHRRTAVKKEGFIQAGKAYKLLFLCTFYPIAVYPSCKPWPHYQR